MGAGDDIQLGAKGALTVGELSGNPWIVGAAVAWLVGDFLWNYFNREYSPPPPHTLLNFPTVSEGSPVPILYGYCHAKQPLMAWLGSISSFEITTGQWSYGFNAIFVPGSSFVNTSVRVLDIRFGGVPTNSSSPTPLFRTFTDPGNQRGYGGFEPQITYWLYNGRLNNQAINGSAQVLNGRAGQINVLGGFSQNWLGDTLLDEGVSSTHIQSYRNLISVIIRPYTHPNNAGSTSEHLPWQAMWSDSPSIPAISFVLLCKSASGGLLAQPDLGEPGCNPIDVLFDILTGPFNKLAIDISQLAVSEFIAAAQVCWDEGILYSRVIDQATPAQDIIGELLAHVNGILYEDMSDGLLHIKLLRADYFTTQLRTIDPTNCVALDSFQMSSWPEVPNMVTVRYTDPATGSQQTVSQSSQATAVGQGGIVNEIVLSYPGCISRDQALTMAARELQIRSRPIMKCRVMTTREFDDLKPGDAVYLSWPKLNISSLVFRVLNLTSGVLNDGKITINLVQDVFYVNKKHPPFPIGDIGDPTWTISF